MVIVPDAPVSAPVARLTVRAATMTDVEAVVSMARRFLSSEGPYGTRFRGDDAKIRQIAEYIINGEDAVGFIAEEDGRAVGMFGMFCFTHPFLGQRFAAELCWWLEPEARGTRAALRMLQAGEAWARAHGADAMEVCAPNEHVAHFYDRLGFERTDIHYLRVL